MLRCLEYHSVSLKLFEIWQVWNDMHSLTGQVLNKWQVTKESLFWISLLQSIMQKDYESPITSSYTYRSIIRSISYFMQRLFTFYSLYGIINADHFPPICNLSSTYIYIYASDMLCWRLLGIPDKDWKKWENQQLVVKWHLTIYSEVLKLSFN